MAGMSGMAGMAEIVEMVEMAGGNWRWFGMARCVHPPQLCSCLAPSLPLHHLPLIKLYPRVLLLQSSCFVLFCVVLLLLLIQSFIKTRPSPMHDIPAL